MECKWRLKVKYCLFILFGLLTTACSGPLGPIPGGKLSGERASLNEGWGFAENTDHVQLETLDPDQNAHSVNVWSGVLNDRLFIPTSLVRGAEEPTERQWVQNAMANESVRIKIDGKLYEGVINRVTQPALADRVKEVIIAKYNHQPDTRSSDAWIFEIALPPTNGQ